MSSTILLLMTLLPSGQTTQPAAAAVELGDTYADVMFGFTIRPPKDWQANTRREYNGHATLVLQLMEPALSNRPRAIIVEHVGSPRTVEMKDRLRQAELMLNVELTQPKTDVSELRAFDGRPGAYLSAHYRVDEEERFRLTAIIEIAPRNYLMMRHDGRGEDRADTEAIFRAVMDSIRLLAKPLTEKELRTALDAGADWMKEVDAARLKAALMATQYFLYEQNGKPIGLLEITERENRVRRGKTRYDGIEITQQSWMFDAPAAVRRYQHRIQIDDDFEREEWQSSAVTWIRPAGDTPEQFENAYQEGLRSLDVLLSSQSSSLSEPVKTNPPLKLPRTYITRTLTNLLPRLLGNLDKPRTLAFLTFDHELGVLVQKIVEIKGETTLPGEPDGRKIYRIDDRVGVAAEPAQMFVDEGGRVLLVKTRNWTLRPAAPDELRKLFEERVKDCEEAAQRMEQLYQDSGSRFIRPR